MRDATVVFDLDGTLIDTAPDLVATANYVLGTVGLDPLPDSALKPLIGRGSRAMIESGLAHHGVVLPETEVTRLHALFLKHYADNVAVASRPYEGVPELIPLLLDEGARLAICTNKVELLSKMLLEQLGMSRHFRAVAGRDTFAVCKPHPGHLTGTIALAGGQVANAVMIGDTDVDFATANAAGVPSIGVTFGYSERPVAELGPTAVIDHYSELPAALEKVLKARASAS
jgi:phosphoglycolate phosphatase